MLAERLRGVLAHLRQEGVGSVLGWSELHRLVEEEDGPFEFERFAHALGWLEHEGRLCRCGPFYELGRSFLAPRRAGPRLRQSALSAVR